MYMLIKFDILWHLTFKGVFYGDYSYKSVRYANWYKNKYSLKKIIHRSFTLDIFVSFTSPPGSVYSGSNMILSICFSRLLLITHLSILHCIIGNPLIYFDMIPIFVYIKFNGIFYVTMWKKKKNFKKSILFLLTCCYCWCIKYMQLIHYHVVWITFNELAYKVLKNVINLSKDHI